MAEDDPVESKSTEEEQNTVLPDVKNTGSRPEVAAADVIDDSEIEDAVEPAASLTEPIRGQRLNKALSAAERKVVSWFAACGRCSFFLAGYRLTCSEAAWETAVAQRKKNWLVLPWSHAAVNLVHKGYGSQIDVDCYHYEGQCRECHRRFVFQVGEDESEPATFRIELKP